MFWLQNTSVDQDDARENINAFLHLFFYHKVALNESVIYLFQYSCEFDWFLVNCPWFWLIICCPYPGAEMKRIHTEPDPKHRKILFWPAHRVNAMEFWYTTAYFMTFLTSFGNRLYFWENEPIFWYPVFNKNISGLLTHRSTAL